MTQTPLRSPLTAVPSPLRAVPGVEPPRAASAGFRARAADLGVTIGSRLRGGDLEVDLDIYEVRRSGVPLPASPRQVELLALLLAAPGRVYSRDQLHWACWQDLSPSRRVDVQLCRLRAKAGVELRNVRDRGWALRSTPTPT